MAEAQHREGAAPEAEATVDPRSSMTPRFNWVFRWFARRFLIHFELDRGMVARVRDLEAQGSVIYVMRYSSRLDYLLFNTLFLRFGLRLSSFANGLHFYYYRPLVEMLRVALARPRGRPREVERSEDQEFARAIAREGGSFFLFLRTARVRSFLRGRRVRNQDELDLLEEVVREVWDGPNPVAIVPLAIFWRKGPRSESRFLNLSYGSVTRPSDISKVASFLANYRGLTVKTGDPIDLRGFIDDHREEGRKRVARKVRRSILMYLYREEKVVEGPTLRAPHRVYEDVIRDPGVQRALRERAAQPKSSPEKARLEAEKLFYEIAANQSSTFLALLAWLVGVVLNRMFASIEVTGLEKVADYAKRNPLVLVPNHRSYFDFLIGSWLFYRNYLVPPHIAARDNMAFGPFGFLWRRAGAYFLRGSFEDPLYKEVFRAYVSYLVREGFTQEFFIEGGRSRTGKMLPPRLGMLSWTVTAFLESPRRDLFFIPMAFTYERLVEESSMVRMLEGGAKEKESMIALVRARKYLQRRFGSVHVNFGEPVSLAQAIGQRRAKLGEESDEGVAAKRTFIEALGKTIVEHINWAVVPNATSVASCVLLGTGGHRGILRAQLVTRMQELVDLLRALDVRLTPALEADEGEYTESIAFLVRSDLLREAEDPRGAILYFEENKRRAFDIYRNSIIHYLAGASFLSRRLFAEPATLAELCSEVQWWQDFLYQEFFAPRGELLAGHVEGLIDHFVGRGWVDHRGDRFVANSEDCGPLPCLSAQTLPIIEGYHAVFGALLQAEGEADTKAFAKEAAEHFRHSQLLGDAHHPEAANDTTFRNAADLLVRRRILERQVGEGKRKTARYARGECWDELPALCDRLAQALSSR